MLRILFFLVIVLAAPPALAKWVTLESGADGRITRYDPDTIVFMVGGVAMWHEIIWPKPVGCAALGCIKTSRARNVYNCKAKATARVSSVDLDEAGRELGSVDTEPRFVALAPGSATDRVLFQAACAPPGARKPG
jgi:hypothetical protein